MIRSSLPLLPLISLRVAQAVLAVVFFLTAPTFAAQVIAWGGGALRPLLIGGRVIGGL